MQHVVSLSHPNRAWPVDLPAEVSRRLIKGESLLKAIRQWRRLTQVEVDAQTGIGQGYLSDLESGRRQGTIETLTKLAQFYAVPSAWLIAGGTP